MCDAVGPRERYREYEEGVKVRIEGGRAGRNHGGVYGVCAPCKFVLSIVCKVIGFVLQVVRGYMNKSKLLVRGMYVHGAMYLIVASRLQD